MKSMKNTRSKWKSRYQCQDTSTLREAGVGDTVVDTVMDPEIGVITGGEGRMEEDIEGGTGTIAEGDFIDLIEYR